MLRTRNAPGFTHREWRRAGDRAIVATTRALFDERGRRDAPAAELREPVSGAVWLRLGRGMAAFLGPLKRMLASGAEQSVFAIDAPDVTTNWLYTQVLGSMHLARAGVGVREAAPGVAETFDIDPERVREGCVQDALALARIAEGAPA